MLHFLFELFFSVIKILYAITANGNNDASLSLVSLNANTGATNQTIATFAQVRNKEEEKVEERREAEEREDKAEKRRGEEKIEEKRRSREGRNEKRISEEQRKEEKTELTRRSEEKGK